MNHVASSRQQGDGENSALYNDFEFAVVDEEDPTEWFKIRTGVKRGCNMSGILLVVDWVMEKTLQESNTGIRRKITDFVDDIALIS